MEKLDAVIFDFDGTLAELTLDLEAMKHRLAALAEAFFDTRPVPTTQPALEWLDTLAHKLRSSSPAAAAELHSRGRLLITAMEMDAARAGALFPATRPLLETLSRRGIASGIITRNIAPAVQLVFPDIKEKCDVFIPREKASKIKPHPDHLLQALQYVNARPSHSLMTGDHPLDIQTAHNAGVASAAVTTGTAPPEAFSACKPDYMAQSLEDLIQQLENHELL